MGPIGMDADEIRLKVFRELHPEWHIYAGEFGTWHAERDTGHGSDTHVRYQLLDLLDVLEGRSS